MFLVSFILQFLGIAERWKQVVAYHYTGRSMNGASLKNLITQIVTKAFSIGLNVVAVTSDMGPGNQALWREFGVHSKRESISSSALINGANIHFLADIPHVVKNLCTAFLKHRKIILSENVCSTFNLVSNEVSIAHIEDLVNFQDGKSLKLTPKLTKETLTSTSHFKKMNVSTALHVFSNAVAAGLRYLVEKEGRSKDYLTTAWFVKFVDSWFELTTSRHPVMALSTKKRDVYIRARQTLSDFMDITQSMQIGERAVWKPVQSGILLSSLSILHLCDELLNTKLDFLLTSRLTQDCVENLFSLVRSKNPTPTAREFKYALKIICTAQYLKEIKSSNYQQYDREYLGELLPTEIVPLQECIGLDVHELAASLSNAKEESLYYLAGYCVRSLGKLKQLCTECIESLKHTDCVPHPKSSLLRFKNFKDGALLEVKSDVYEQFRKWEGIVKSLQRRLKDPKIVLTMNQQCLLETDSSVFSTRKCHPVLERLVAKFISVRIHIMCKEATDATAARGVSLGSRSMAMRDLILKV